MWSREDFAAVCRPPVIGMIHLDPLPGAPGFEDDLAAVISTALSDADALVAGGIGAVMIENFHDVPFYRGRVPAHTVAAMAVIVDRVRRRHPDLAVGVNVLRNDAAAALAIAAATGASYVRVNVHGGAAVTDQGLIQGQAHRTLRLRRDLGLVGRSAAVPGVGIFADVQVKHARALVPRGLVATACDLRRRGLADAVIVTGDATGAPADPRELSALREALPDCPLLVGSGADPTNLAEYTTDADGFIVGTAIQTHSDGRGRASTGATERWLDAHAAASRDQRTKR
jgi:membrane complex biogenesis BtpA family protein